MSSFNSLINSKALFSDFVIEDSMADTTLVTTWENFLFAASCRALDEPVLGILWTNLTTDDFNIIIS